MARYNILFVCHGNICRSPMAEFILKSLVKAKGLESEMRKPATESTLRPNAALPSTECGLTRPRQQGKSPGPTMQDLTE